MKIKRSSRAQNKHLLLLLCTSSIRIFQSTLPDWKSSHIKKFYSLEIFSILISHHDKQILKIIKSYFSMFSGCLPRLRFKWKRAAAKRVRKLWWKMRIHFIRREQGATIRIKIFTNAVQEIKDQSVKRGVFKNMSLTEAWCKSREAENSNRIA